MTDIIHLLPDSVANQIAAGEVIQRPASVIKELVENAVDAGAHTIHVLVVDAGRTSIQVIDDGKGMSETDARLAFERHATSKIAKADDLFALYTMGFRGEALASIAAVAQVDLTTRLEGEQIGTHITIAGSRVQEQEPVSCPVGSNFKIENLFYNVPARRKFLKSNTTELNNILTAYERIVLVYPEIHFTFHSNGAELLNLKPATLRQRIADVFGRQYEQDLLPLSVETTLCRVTGFVAKPEAARKKSGRDYFFVNGRYMKHPYFHKAVLTAYERLIPEGMQIPYFIYFDVAPADIDVNIHPTKTEIKFENEQAIWQIVVAAVRDAIGKFSEIPSIDFDTVGKPEIPVFDPTRNVAPPSPQYNPDYNPFATGSRPTAASFPIEEFHRPVSDAPNASAYGERNPDSFGGFPKADFPSAGSRLQPPLEGQTALFPDTASSDTLLSDKSPVHYQYKGRYIMTAVKSGLMIIDQHRASVRVLYERYENLLRSKVIPTQKLLFPEILKLGPSDAVVMERMLAEFGRLGFDISNLGGNSFAVNGVPVDVQGIEPSGLLTELLADAQEQTAVDTSQQADNGLTAVNGRLLASMARRAAVPYGQVLTNEEMESLVNELFSCRNVNYTPDGKSVLCIFPQTEIEQLLGG
nr:DNA mismatch repair endonuclease MutL [Prevotella sp.]